MTIKLFKEPKLISWGKAYSPYRAEATNSKAFHVLINSQLLLCYHTNKFGRNFSTRVADPPSYGLKIINQGFLPQGASVFLLRQSRIFGHCRGLSGQKATKFNWTPRPSKKALITNGHCLILKKSK